MKISIIIPVLNEAANISDCITFIQALHQPQIQEIIVVDGGSTDGTVDLAKQTGVCVLKSDFASRAVQMNLGAKNSMGDILYFIHADIKLLPCFVDDIFQSIEMGYAAGCYSYRFDSDKSLLKFNAFFTRFKGIFCGGGDQTLFVKRDVFNRLGAFNEYYSIMEDFDLSRRLMKNYKFRVIKKNIVVSARKYQNNSWLRVQLANLAVFVMFLLKFNPEMMKSTYRKLLKYHY